MPPDTSFENMLRIRALPEAERHAAIAPIREHLRTQVMAPAAAPTTLSAADYLTQLAALDVTSIVSVNSFFAASQLRPVDPIPLGTHKGVTYVLTSSTDTVPVGSASQLTPLTTMRQLSSTVNAYNSIPIPTSPGGSCPLKFGIPLGRLQHWVDSTSTPCDPSASGASLINTGFYVLLNAIDKSIWVTIDFFPDDGYHQQEPLDPASGEAWGFLPNDYYLQIGTMKISQMNWSTTTPLAICGADPFVGNAALGCRLESGPAVLSQLQAALGAQSGAATGG